MGASPRRGSRGASLPGRWWSVTTTSSPRPRRLRDLVDRGDPAVHGQQEADTVLDDAGDRLAGDPVALLEAAREVPGDVGVELAEERGRQARSHRSRRRHSRRGHRCDGRRRSPVVAPRPRLACRRAGTDRAPEARKPETDGSPPDPSTRGGRARTRSPRSTPAPRPRRSPGSGRAARSPMLPSPG